MTGGLSHDFNNLLAVIIGNIELLEESTLDEAGRDFAERALRAADRGATLTHQLLDYAGMGTLDIEPVDLSKLVREMVELLQ